MVFGRYHTGGGGFSAASTMVGFLGAMPFGFLAAVTFGFLEAVTLLFLVDCGVPVSMMMMFGGSE